MLPGLRVARGSSRPARWLRRYGPLELAGTATALAAAWAVHAMSGQLAFAAVAGTIGENVGYYGLAAWVAMRRHARTVVGTANGDVGAWAGALAMGWRGTRDLVVEFGPAEVVDSAWVRPGLMFAMSGWLGVGAGILVGKLLADIVFYAVAIGCRELQERRPSVAAQITGEA